MQACVRAHTHVCMCIYMRAHIIVSVQSTFSTYSQHSGHNTAMM